MPQSFKQGELVRIKTADRQFEGVFINQEQDHLILKLDNGYNIGIARKKIKEKKKLGRPDRLRKDVKRTKPAQDSKLINISLLHTGGTIASKVDYKTGAVIARFTPADILELFPELRKMANINSSLISNMLSENMRFAHYNAIARAVEKEIKKGAKGVIVTHGTDTLHYTAAGLSFALQGLNIPVVLVGSQRSSDRPSSDSPVNLLSAVMFIKAEAEPGVYTCMHRGTDDDKCMIIRGVSSRKMHTSRRDAFRPINKGLVATADYENQKIIMHSGNAQRISSDKKALKLKLFKPDLKIGLLKTHPNMHAEELEAYKGADGLVIEGTGLGHIGITAVDKQSEEHKKIRQALSELAKNMPVAMASQTIYGRINMNVYSTGRELKQMGIMGDNTDMTPETAFVKLAWLLSNYNDKKEIKELYEKSLCREISERSEQESFLL